MLNSGTRSYVRSLTIATTIVVLQALLRATFAATSAPHASVGPGAGAAAAAAAAAIAPAAPAVATPAPGAGGASGASASDSRVASGLQVLLQAAKRYRSRDGGGAGPPLLRPRQMARAMYLGDSERIRGFVRRMALGEPLTVALLGGSVSKGMGAVEGEPSYEAWLAAWLAAVAPNRTAAAAVVNGTAAGSSSSTVRIVNAACPATSSAYMNMCLGEYLREGHLVDLVLVEYAINDDPFPYPPWENEARKSLELLLRKLLSLPRRPAVVLLNTFRWHSGFNMPETKRPSDRLYYTNSEGDYFTLATYYGLPMLSLKAAVYHQMAAGVRGFQVHTLRYKERGNASADPAALFYEDPMHPSGLTGHRVISELVAGLLLHVARGLLMRPWRESESELASAPLPAHMIPGNVDSQLDVCLMGTKLREAAREAEGFTWLNEGRNPRAPKWGFTATSPGASLLLDPLPGLGPAPGGSAAAPPGAAALVILAYLRSYENMGVAHVRCEGGCVCGERALQGAGAEAAGASATSPVVAVLDGHWEQGTSQLQLGCFPARLAPGCRVRVTVAGNSRSGRHKVKLGGLVVSHTSPHLAGLMCADNLEAAQRAAGYRER